MAKYDPLKLYLLSLPVDRKEITFSFAQVEKIISVKLPPSAHDHRAWWSNEEHGVHVSAKAWLDAGWRVDTVNQREQWVRFRRQPPSVQNKPVLQITPPTVKKTYIDVKRTMFSANRLVKTLTIHKPDCRFVPWDKLNPCGCGDTGERNNHHWFCEEHITREAIDKFMNENHWAILMCDICFR